MGRTWFEQTASLTVPQKFCLAMIQMLVGADKEANLQKADKMVREAAEKGAQVVSLPVS